MNKSHLFSAVCAVLFTLITMSANAALLGRDLDGNLSTAEAYYDDVADLSWLANANAAGTTTTWAAANTWAANLDIDGVAGADGWRLPATLQPDASCSDQLNPGGGFGTGCTGSEMGNLYNVEGVTTAAPGPFSNIQSGPVAYYWSTEVAPNASPAWVFNFSVGIGPDSGNQGTGSKNGTLYYAWAVQSGNVGAAVVPIPAAVWLFSSGLLGLVAMARRKQC